MPGSFADPAITDPTLNASDIALLKGILTKLGGTNGPDAGGAARVSLYGKNVTAADKALLTDNQGSLQVVLFGANGGASPLVSQAADLSGNATSLLYVDSYASLFNNASWDRQRGNYEATVLASAARTVATDSADQINYNARGVVIAVDVTAWAAGSLTITVQGKSTLSGQYSTLLTSAALGAVATTFLTIYPGVTVAANVAVSAPLPRIFKVHVAVGGAQSITYSIDANFIL